MENRNFKIKKTDLIDFLRSKSKNPNYSVPKDLDKVEIKPDADDISRGYLTVFIEL